MSGSSSSKATHGNPQQIATVKKMAISVLERLRGKLPESARKSAEMADMASMLGMAGRQAPSSQDVAFQAYWSALCETRNENEETCAKWRASLSEDYNLSGADFSGLMFLGFDFSGWSMERTSFAGCYLDFCKFRGAHLERANFHGATLVTPLFSGARLARADFSGANLTCPVVSEATDFTGAVFTGCRVETIPHFPEGPKLVNAFRARLSNEQQKQLKGHCFIATAACGDADAWEVVTLQRFRDTVLTPTALGRWLVSAYYCISPRLAAVISQRAGLRWMVRSLLIRPFARMASQLMAPPDRRRQA